MASLSKTYTHEKKFGQIYTPDYIVAKILDDIGYSDERLLGKTILDPACGDGRFLVQVVERIIRLSPKENLEQNLACVYGWDIDPEAVRECIENLNELIQGIDIQLVWNIKIHNSIEEKSEHHLFAQAKMTFDFIVGNPPYIRIQHLEDAQRKLIQANYNFCKSGSTDIYIAFYELALSLLAPSGICGFITPNTFFYTETAKPMRAFFAAQSHLKKITNYADIQVFTNATTYSAIVIFDKKINPSFTFEKALTEKTFAERQIKNVSLSEKVWQLSMEEKEQIIGKRLGEVVNIHVGITTLCDKAYIMKFIRTEGDYLILNSRLKGEVKLEIGILKPIIKASLLKSGDAEIKEYVLFPYYKNQIINELELKSNFPLAYQYLCDVREELDKRDAGKPNSVAWYAYGRSQGLQTSFGRKILFSPMNLRPNFILSENTEATFYSGYCIKYDGDMSALLEQLNSERMQQYISVSSRDFRGGWKAYNKKILEDFVVTMEL
jgi:methylase of polypeptide subunit release factors